MSKQKSKISGSLRIVSKKVLLLILFIVIVLGVVLWATSIPRLLDNSPSDNPDAATLADLKDYALELINSDRQASGLQNVSLSAVESAQTHANDMLVGDYFSHWDMNGYKPYMRYTLAGGKGAVDENIAYLWSQDSISNIKEVLSRLEYKMMFDDASSDWRHKENILQVSHDKVSIGIAFDSSRVYLVQDFEDEYVDWTTFAFSNGSVTMQGKLNEPNLVISQIAINYDKTVNLTSLQLSTPPYQGSYDWGATIGSVVPPQWQSDSGITITAQRWYQAQQTFNIEFDMSKAFLQYGTGVYTLYIWTESGFRLTTFSIWYNQ